MGQLEYAYRDATAVTPGGGPDTASWNESDAEPETSQSARRHMPSEPRTYEQEDGSRLHLRPLFHTQSHKHLWPAEVERRQTTRIVRERRIYEPKPTGADGAIEESHSHR